MEEHLKETTGPGSRTDAVREFAKRVMIALSVMAALFSAAVALLIYLPLKAELEKSLVENFSQLSYIRYATLQNNMERGLEGARSMSSRTVIRDAILAYKKDEISLDELAAVTQSKYEDGASALEYLLNAEHFVDDNMIARYTVEGYESQTCTAWDSLAKDAEASSTLCLTDGSTYFAVRSPILSQGQLIGYDLLTFDLSGQIHALCTETVRSELVSHDEFEALISGASMLRSSETRCLFQKDGAYCQAFQIQGSSYFITRQSGDVLLEAVHRLSRQVLFTGVGVLLIFTWAVYFFVIRHAKHELEDGCSSLKHAVSVANTDPLTKAGSRRLGEELLFGSFGSFQKGEPSPAVMLFDIDSLKQINDLHGHSAGDVIIRSVAEAVQGNIRGGDMLMRWGGDEFIGIFHGLRQENAVPFAQKLLDTVSSLRVDTDTGTINPTISMGISYFRREDRGFIDAVNRADRAMYRAKSEGKNRVREL